MAEENWSQKQRKQIYLNYAADSMKENVYRCTKKWVCLKSAFEGWWKHHWHQRKWFTLAGGEHWGTGTTSTSSSWWFPSPSLLLSTLQPGLETHWNPFSNSQRRLWSTFCRVQCFGSWKCFPGLYQGHFARTRVHPLGECSQGGKWGFHLSVPPSCLPVPSSSTDFSLGVKMTHEPSLIMAHLVPKGQLCVVSVLFLSILSPFLSGCSICCYHVGFFP